MILFTLPDPVPINPLAPVLLVQTRCHREDSACECHVLAEEDHPVVGRQLLVERLADGGTEVDRRRHRFAPGFDRSEKKGERVLEQLSQPCRESGCVGAVDGAMIGGQREGGDVAKRDAPGSRLDTGFAPTAPTARIAT